ncbi:MAG: acetyl-CoA carboxylase biotin carboxyl carrier protein subunit, partial [Arthrobacter sp.]|nr:acetyl-CoA carboxylase biotin carboxyl carrier protein subunit [Arthrobacter sp.]
LGIVEIMKQFTEIQSDVAGVLESFEVNEGDMVNPGDAIIVIREG